MKPLRGFGISSEAFVFGEVIPCPRRVLKISPPPSSLRMPKGTAAS